MKINKFYLGIVEQPGECRSKNIDIGKGYAISYRITSPVRYLRLHFGQYLALGIHTSASFKSLHVRWNFNSSPHFGQNSADTYDFDRIISFSFLDSWTHEYPQHRHFITDPLSALKLDPPHSGHFNRLLLKSKLFQFGEPNNPQ